MTPPPISLVLLVHQEADIIESVIKDFYEKVTSRIPGSEFIICEDGSTDGTKEILERVKDHYRLSLYMGNERRGYTNALREALGHARNPVIFFSDSDGQHDPNDFWKMYPVLDGVDMVIGRKLHRKDGLMRLILTRVFNRLIALYFGVRLHDINCGFRLMQKEVVDFLLGEHWRLKYCISAELTVRAHYRGFRIREVPVRHFARQFGMSTGLPTKKLPRIITHILKEFRAIKKEVRP